MKYSYSRISRYLGCPRRYQYERILKLVPANPPSTTAADRGTLLHSMAEQYIKNEVATLPTELIKFQRVLSNMQETGCIPEAKLAINDKMEPVEYDSPDVKFFGIIDTIEFQPSTLILGDWKSGQVRDYSPQLSFYGMLGGIHYKDHGTIKLRARFIDQGRTVEYPFSRSDIELTFMKYSQHVEMIEKDLVFAPNPSAACAFCPYSKKRGGPCKW